MSERLRCILMLVALVMCVIGLARAAIVGQGTDGKTYLMLDSDEAEQLGERMKAMAAEIKRLKDERKTECGLI